MPIDEGVVGELERRLRSAEGALRAIDRRLAGARAGSLADLVVTRRTLHTVLDAIDRGGLRDVCVAIESVVAEMTMLEAALAVVRRLRLAPGGAGPEAET